MVEVTATDCAACNPLRVLMPFSEHIEALVNRDLGTPYRQAWTWNHVIKVCALTFPVDRRPGALIPTVMPYCRATRWHWSPGALRCTSNPSFAAIRRRKPITSRSVASNERARSVPTGYSSRTIPFCDWRERMLDLFDGLAQAQPGYSGCIPYRYRGRSPTTDQ